jgi:hypothetical protein
MYSSHPRSQVYLTLPYYYHLLLSFVITLTELLMFSYNTHIVTLQHSHVLLLVSCTLVLNLSFAYRVCSTCLYICLSSPLYTLLHSLP